MKHSFRFHLLDGKSARPLVLLAATAVLITVFLRGPLAAQEALSWQACVREALAGHPDLTSAREALNQALADRDIARSPALPQVAANAGSDRSYSEGQGGATTHSYGVTASQLLYDGGKTSHQATSAEAAIASSRYTYDVTSSRIRLELRAAFVELLHARELLAITEDIARRRNQNLELVRLRYQAGREHRGSLLSAQANAAQAEYEIRAARRAVSLAEWRLEKALGRKESRPITVAGDLTPPPAGPETPDFEKLARENPFLKELIAQKEIALSARGTARSGFFPQVYADASAGRSDSDFLPEKDRWSVGLSLSVPLFEGGGRFAEMKKADAGIRRAEANEKSGYAETLHTLRSAWTDFQNAADRVAVGRAFVEASAERAKIAQVEYSNGLTSFDTWTLIEDALERDRKNHLTWTADALIAEAYWAQARGETLENDLEKN